MFFISIMAHLVVLWGFPPVTIQKVAKMAWQGYYMYQWLHKCQSTGYLR